MTGIGDKVATTATADGPPSGLPVRIDLVRTIAGPDDTHVTAVPLALTNSELIDLNSLNHNAPGYRAWFAAHGAVDVYKTVIQLVIEGNRAHEVRVVGMEPIVRCANPLSGTIFYSPSAGDEPVTRLLVNLDAPGSRPLFYDANNVKQDFFAAHTIVLKQSEQFAFEIDAATEKHDCKFTLDLTILDGDKAFDEQVDDGGKPFEATAPLYANTAGDIAFSGYRGLYVGGVADGAGQGGHWAPGDPSSYAG